MLAPSVRYGVGPNGFGVEPKPSAAIHTTRSQRCVVARGSFGARGLLRLPGDLRPRGTGQPGSGTAAVPTWTGQAATGMRPLNPKAPRARLGPGAGSRDPAR